MIDFLLLAIIAGVTYCVASEGAWGAGILLVSVVLSGLVAMNFFEPVANALGSSGGSWSTHWDLIALVGLFALGVFGLRAASEQLMPTYLPVTPLVYDIGRWTMGLLTGYTTAAILLTALHTAPLPREFLGFRAERKNLFERFAPDRQWLGFTQYVSEKAFRRGRTGPIFDGPVFARNRDDRSTSQVWATFPIRYASRREQLASGGLSGGPGGAPPSSSGSGPPPTTRPRGSSNPGF